MVAQCRGAFPDRSRCSRCSRRPRGRSSRRGSVRRFGGCTTRPSSRTWLGVETGVPGRSSTPGILRRRSRTGRRGRGCRAPSAGGGSTGWRSPGGRRRSGPRGSRWRCGTTARRRPAGSRAQCTRAARCYRTNRCCSRRPRDIARRPDRAHRREAGTRAAVRRRWWWSRPSTRDHRRRSACPWRRRRPRYRPRQATTGTRRIQCMGAVHSLAVARAMR